MRLPLKTEYACQVLAQLALTYSKEGVRQADDLAAKEGLSANYLLQILTSLRQAGLVISRRGKNGGYLLARSPEEITLAEIAMAMEGERLIESSPGNGGMSAESVQAAWEKVDAGLMAACGEITLAELAPKSEEEVAADWVI